MSIEQNVFRFLERKVAFCPTETLKMIYYFGHIQSHIKGDFLKSCHPLILRLEMDGNMWLAVKCY